MFYLHTANYTLFAFSSQGDQQDCAAKMKMSPFPHGVKIGVRPEILRFFFKRLGHLFQGRFKSILVDDEEYLKELVRYIHLNPVRARLVRHVI
jgi:hypothetical protein